MVAVGADCGTTATSDHEGAAVWVARSVGTAVLA